MRRKRRRGIRMNGGRRKRGGGIEGRSIRKTEGERGGGD